MNEEAIQFVMAFYGISREVTLDLYMDEVESYLNLLERQKMRTEIENMINTATSQEDLVKKVADYCCYLIGNIATNNPADIYDVAERNAIGEATMRIRHTFGINKK